MWCYSVCSPDVVVLGSDLLDALQDELVLRRDPEQLLLPAHHTDRRERERREKRWRRAHTRRRLVHFEVL